MDLLLLQWTMMLPQLQDVREDTTYQWMETSCAMTVAGDVHLWQGCGVIYEHIKDELAWADRQERRMSSSKPKDHRKQVSKQAPASDYFLARYPGTIYSRTFRYHKYFYV